MKTFSMMAAAMVLGLSLVAADAEAAKRLGGGKSFGTQRQAQVDKSPNATPAQTPGAPAAAAAPAQSAAAAAPAAAAAQPKRSWMGPVAGLAAGLGLAALASHLGFGDELASMLMIGLKSCRIAEMLMKRCPKTPSMFIRSLLFISVLVFSCYGWYA